MSQPSKIVSRGRVYHVNAGTVRRLVQERDWMRDEIDNLNQCLNFAEEVEKDLEQRLDCALLRRQAG